MSKPFDTTQSNTRSNADALGLLDPDRLERIAAILNALAPALETTHSNAPNTRSHEDDDALPLLDPNRLERFAAILNALTPAETTRLRQLVGELSPEALCTWIADVAELSVTDAVAKLLPIVGTPKT